MRIQGQELRNFRILKQVLFFIKLNLFSINFYLFIIPLLLKFDRRERAALFLAQQSCLTNLEKVNLIYQLFDFEILSPNSLKNSETCSCIVIINLHLFDFQLKNIRAMSYFQHLYLYIGLY